MLLCFRLSREGQPRTSAPRRAGLDEVRRGGSMFLDPNQTTARPPRRLGPTSMMCTTGWLPGVANGRCNQARAWPRSGAIWRVRAPRPRLWVGHDSPLKGRLAPPLTQSSPAGHRWPLAMADYRTAMERQGRSRTLASLSENRGGVPSPLSTARRTAGLFSFDGNGEQVGTGRPRAAC